jgi:Pentapeptide repeats (8 copies)
MRMTTYKIKHRHTGAVLYTGGGESLRNVVVAAVKRGADLGGAYLRSAYLSGANLSGADLGGADLSSANLSSANLSGADLGGADLSSANLRGANLSGANLSSANLSSANLSGADFGGAYLSGAKLVGTRPILQIGPLGSRADYLVAYFTDTGVRIRAGCFFGSLEEFSAAVVKTHGESDYGREYAAAISMIEAHAAIWTPAVEPAQEAA